MAGQILVVEDDPLLSKMLEYLLTDAGFAVHALTDPRVVPPFLANHAIELILLDVALPFVDGFTLAATIRSTYPLLPIIFLSARAQLEDKLRGLETGEDYLTKPFEPAELLARMQKVLDRSRQAARHDGSAQLTVGDVTLSLKTLQFRVVDRPPVLVTPTEMKLLEYLMRHAGQVVSRTALIEATWESDYEGFGNRLDVYIRRLRHKIEMSPEEPQYVQTVRGSGYVFRVASHGERWSASHDYRRLEQHDAS